MPASVVLEVPGAPVISVLLPRNRPPPSISSSRCKPGRHALARCFLRDVGGSRRCHGHAVRAEAQRKLAGRKRGAAVLGDLEAAHGNSLLHAAIEAHYAVDHELHEAVVGDIGARAFRVDLGRDDGGQLASGSASRAGDRSRASSRAACAAATAARRCRRTPSTARRSPVCFAASMASMPPRSKSPAATKAGDSCASMKNRLLARQARQAPVEGGGIGDDRVDVFLERDEDARLLAAGWRR